jgi:hypothetical protein
LNKFLKSGDCILTLGAGDVTLLGNLLLEIWYVKKNNQFVKIYYI